jgi:hypothetical protein
MIYQTHFGYPDMIDYRSIANRYFAKKAIRLEESYQDFRTTYEWLRIAYSCYKRGKNRPIALTDLKKMAERFVGRELNEDAFLVGVFFVVSDRNLTKPRRKCENLKIRVPNFDVEKIEVGWRAHEEDRERRAAETAAVNEGGTNGRECTYKGGPEAPSISG